MKVSRLYIIIIFLCLNLVSFGQKISEYTFSSASGAYNSNLRFDYVVGQIITNSNSNAITAGILKNYKKTEKKSFEKINCKMSFFPNPTRDFVNIIITSKFEIENIDVQIFDILGEKINIQASDIQRVSNYSKIKLNISNLPTGNYQIIVFVNNLPVETNTIIKL